MSGPPWPKCGSSISNRMNSLVAYQVDINHGQIRGTGKKNKIDAMSALQDNEPRSFWCFSHPHLKTKHRSFSSSLTAKTILLSLTGT